MSMTNITIGRRALPFHFSLALALVSIACAEGPTGPGDGVDPTPFDTATVLPATNFGRADVTTTGNVTQTDDGFTVDGSMTLATSDTSSVTFENADVRVRFDAAGNMTSVSGTVEVPSPHERITFDDPIRAEIGLFKGRFLNEERDLGILLKDDTDYFVYDIAVALKMNIATGETGEDAHKPISVKAPLGGRILMVIDYTDPMYYVYGEQDLLGAMGMGWSLNSRIPFVPQRQIANLGEFDGANIRTGKFPIFKVFLITGETVDNAYTELHLSEEDPFSSDLRQGFQQGWNGSFDLDLSIKDVFGLVIPVADGSGGIFAEASVQDIFQGHAYGVGRTTDDFSWYPTFIPMKPASEMGVEAFVTSEGNFEVALDGQYGWEFPDGLYAMGGGFSISDEAMELEGRIVNADVTWEIAGRVESDRTVVWVTPPPELLEAIHGDVNDEILPRIEEAQAAWENLKEATSDYEIELSLRGLRTQLPGIVDAAKREIINQINAELRKHEGTIYYSSLRTHLLAARDDVIETLNNLKAAAQNATDNQTTRNVLERELRATAANKIMSGTYRYQVLGRTVKTVNYSKRVMSDGQANTLINAANNVWRIQETSNLKISMGQIYDQIPDKQIFEQVKDNIQDGLVVIREIGELGFVYPHAAGEGAYHAFAVIDGTRHEVGTLRAMEVDAFAALLFDVMLGALGVG